MYKVPGQHEHNGIQFAAMYPDEVLDRLPEFKFRSDDVLIASFPKSGRIWLEEGVWLLCNDADFEEAGKQNLRLRLPPIEIKIPKLEANMDKISRMSSPRVISTFMQYPYFATNLEATRNKVIVLLRNPKDVLVSYYHFHRMCTVLGNFSGTWDEYFELVKAKGLSLGDWFDHTQSWWTPNKDKENFLFLHFEDMKNNPPEQIEKIATFLGKEFDKGTIDIIAKHTSFESLKNNKTTNMTDIPSYKQDISPFMRKGIVGDWKNYFSDEQNEFVASRMKSLVADGLNIKYE